MTLPTGDGALLFLGDPDNPLLAWLRDREPVVAQTSAPVTASSPEVIDATWLVSYGYRHILRKPVLDRFAGRAVNLHVSFLPWNRGADPNLWSFVDDTPKGVTIHHLDEGVDTGDVIVQRELRFELDGDETLASTYAQLQRAIQELFVAHWPSIKRGDHPRLRQEALGRGTGSTHRARDRARVEHLLTHGWNTPVRLLRRTST